MRRAAKMTFEQYLIGREVVVDYGCANGEFLGVIVAMPDDGGDTRLVQFSDGSKSWVEKRDMRLG